jgi:chorismate mutase
MRPLPRLAFAFALASAIAFADTPPDGDAVVRLKQAIADRLLLMDDVARYKWNHALPVFDAGRERMLLDRTVAAATALGVPSDYARRAIEGQIAASRARQNELIEGWRHEQRPAFTDVPDLATLQRPAIDRATTRLLTQLRATMCDLDAADARAELQAPPPALARSPAIWSTAVDPLWPTPVACGD